MRPNDRERIYKLQATFNFIKNCTQCPLSCSRKNIVFSGGAAVSPLMIIGEGPGVEEDQAGEPFVGRSGKLLDEALQAAGFSRENFYITNMVKCRPPGNRDPSPEEKEACQPILLNQIDIIQPWLIITLGKVAGEYAVGKKIKITQDRGKLFPFSPRPKFNVLLSLHPSYILRNRSEKNLKTFFGDIAKAREVFHDNGPAYAELHKEST